jgi:hypothetical protein
MGLYARSLSHPPEVRIIVYLPEGQNGPQQNESDNYT